MKSAGNCADCEFKYDAESIWCYMFREPHHSVCHFYRPTWKLSRSEEYKDCTINGTVQDGEEVVTWTDTFGVTWKARFWAHAKREIDKFDNMVERKWRERRET